MIRAYDTKAQIMGIIFILSINFVLVLLRDLIGVGPIPAPVTLILVVLVLLPLGLFGFVLYPTSNPAAHIALGAASVRRSYFVLHSPSSLQAYVQDVEATDWVAEISFEIMKMARLREIKRQRLLRALVAAGLSYVLILIVMLAIAA